MSHTSIAPLFLATLFLHMLGFHAQASTMLPAEFTLHTESRFSLQIDFPELNHSGFNHTGFKHNIDIMPNVKRSNTPFINLPAGPHFAHPMNINTRQHQPAEINTHSAPWLMLTGLLSLSLISRRKQTSAPEEKPLTPLEKTLFHTPDNSIRLSTFDPSHFPWQNPPVSNNHHSNFEFKRNILA